MSKSEFIHSLDNALELLKITPSQMQIDKLRTHYKYLKKYNQLVNLTSIENPRVVAINLFADSLRPFSFLSQFSNIRILDIGPGGGFPSIPLGVFLDDSIEFTLVEKRKKVVYYLEELASTLSLSSYEIVNSRSEDLVDNSDYLYNFDIVVNKATFPDDVFLEKVGCFIRKNGYALHWTQSPLSDELIPDSWRFDQAILPPKGESIFKGIIAVYQKIAE